MVLPDIDIHRSLRRATGPEAGMAVDPDQLSTTDDDELPIDRGMTVAFH
jgi:hypothetical protein